MNPARFEKVVAETMEKMKFLMVTKGGEYAPGHDRLGNFKSGAELTGTTPLQTCLIYLSKHYDSISTYVRDDAVGNHRQRSEPIEGRLDDLMNYCVLLKALIIEQQEPMETTAGTHMERWNQIRGGAPARPESPFQAEYDKQLNDLNRQFAGKGVRLNDDIPF